MNSTDETYRELTHTINPLRLFDKTYQIESVLRLLKAIKSKISPKDKVETFHNIKDFEPTFTGQHTDIANIVAHNNEMKIGVIESIKDVNIQNNTKDVFIKARENELITIDVKADKISLTQKGKEHIIKPEFVEQYKRHQIGSIVDTLSDDKTSKIYVELNGSSDDLQIFKFESGLDLSTLPSTESGKNVVENFKNMEKQGYVDIKDNIATPTKKGAEHVTSQPFTLNSQVLNTSNIENITANMMKQQAGKQTAQAAANTTVKAGSKAASATGVGVVVTVAVEVADKLKQVAKEFNSQKRTL